MKLGPDTICFITGGASGLGEATMRHLIKAGCKVAIADMNEDRMRQLTSEIGSNLISFKCNVTVEEEVKAAVEGTVKHWGKIDAAIASAGVAWPMLTLSSKPDFEMDTGRFKQVLDINVMGSVYVAKYASVAMSKNQPVNGERGVMLFVSSVAAEEGQRGQIAYSASKGAINGLMLPMARDLGKYGIRCVAIAPAMFATPMGAAIQKKVQDRLNKDTPMGRPGQPDEFAHFAGALIENTYVNGVHLRIDGAIKFSHM